MAVGIFVRIVTTVLEKNLYGIFERTSICFRMTVENFVRIVLTVFEKIEKVHN